MILGSFVSVEASGQTEEVNIGWEMWQRHIKKMPQPTLVNIEAGDHVTVKDVKRLIQKMVRFDWKKRRPMRKVLADIRRIGTTYCLGSVED